MSKLLIEHYHQFHHQGRGITMNDLRANGLWILGCRHAVSSYIYKCIKCRTFMRNTEVQKMADFYQLWNPFYIKDGRKELRRFGLLFTCLFSCCFKKLGCEFVMNVASASHMGGAWERQMRTIQNVLTYILNQSSKRLDISSLHTYLYQVMAIINSRPLTTGSHWVPLGRCLLHLITF